MPNIFDEPQSRNEAILQNMLGANNELLEPFSRIEILLLELLNSGSGGGPTDYISYNQQSLTSDQKAQARSNIGAASIDDIGTVFTLKGGVATVNDLPVSNNTIGDVYYVESVSSGYIWITNTSNPNGYWEELGETIDLSAYELKPTIQSVSGTTATIAAQDNTIYKCGEVTSLTVTSAPVTGQYVIRFTSGSTPTVLYLPQALEEMMPSGFTVEANTKYEINVWDNLPLIAGKAVSST